MQYISRYKLNSGQAMITMVIFFVFVSTSALLGAMAPTLRHVRAVHDIAQSKRAYALAESGIEDAIHRLKHGMEISDTETITIDNSTATTDVADGGGGEYTLTSVGTHDDKERTIVTSIITADGYSFSYGVQVGAGGFDLGGNAGVIGNVYANGPVVGANGSFITGTVISAGAGGLIDNVDVGITGEGDAFAHTVNKTVVEGDLYCQIGSNNNKTCDTSRADPEEQNYPLTEEDITKWQDQASATGNIINGDVTISDTTTTLGPAVITGNLTIEVNAEVIITGTVWVQGNVDANNNILIRLDSSYEKSGEIILVDGTTSLSNNANFDGSGTQGSYIMLVSTSDCSLGVGCSGVHAISLDNNVGTVIMNAQNGSILFRNNAGAVAATAELIVLDNNAVIEYEQGLINVNFSSGPSGTFSVDSWEEV